jgi:precorrin-8X/cobalt-precorrin-8 methylmutase
MVTWPSAVPEDNPAMVEEESYRILRSRMDLSRLPRFSRDVTERIIYASADFDYATDLVCDEESLEAAVAALAAGAPVITDDAVTAAGITGCPVVCKFNEPLTRRLARTAGIPREAAAVRLAFGEAGPGAVWVVGGAATALCELLTRGVDPAFVIGLPVGFVGAAEAKDALRASGLPSLTNVSEKGGAVVAAAAFEALFRAAAPADGVLADQGRRTAATDAGTP